MNFGRFAILILLAVSAFGQSSLTNPALTFSRLSDFNVVRLSGSVLRWSPTFSSTTPGNVQIGDTVYTYTAPITITRTSGNGTLRLYVSSSGSRSCVVSDDLTVSGHVCSSGTSFPSGSILRYSWVSTGGSWAATGTDLRAVTTASVGTGSSVTAGQGLIDSAGTFSLDTTYAQTHGSAQAGEALKCHPSSASGTAYACSTNPIWPTTPWVAGSRLHFTPDVNSGTTPTLTLNGTAYTMKRQDGSSMVALDLTAGVPYTLSFDGTYWRVMNVPAASGGGSGTVTSVTATAPLSVANGTTTPAITFDSLFLVETSGFDQICGYKNDLLGAGTTYGRFSLHRDVTNSTSGDTQQTTSTPCQLQITTGSTTNDVSGISQNSNNSLGLFFVAGTAGWRWDGFLTIPSSVANVYVAAGLTHQQGLNPALCTLSSNNCVAIVLDTAVGSHFQLRRCGSGGTPGSCTDTDTGVTAATGTLYRFSLESTTNGTVSASVNGSTPVTGALPSVTLGPSFYVKTLTSATKRVDVHGYSYKGAKRWQ